MATRRASIKETGEEISPAEWARFDAAVARAKAERCRGVPTDWDKPAEATKSKSTVRDR